MEYHDLPLDIVKNILTYDNRFVIRHGHILLINKLDKVRYADAIRHISEKSKIKRIQISPAFEIMYVDFDSNRTTIAYELHSCGHGPIKFCFLNKTDPNYTMKREYYEIT